MQHDKQVSNVPVLLDELPCISHLHSGPQRTEFRKKFSLLVLRKNISDCGVVQNPFQFY